METAGTANSDCNLVRLRAAAVIHGQSKPASFFTCAQGMRGFLPCALLARSMVRASSISSTV